MATYITGSQDYIPALQPFAPDYNFLGNMLQNAQTRYDENYKSLNKTYGSLLNSPMLRDDNIKQRDDYFKMIDTDIKKISGMDLSLQQNVDAANQVFDSFYQNKDMVKDMVFTKEYQKQLQIGENYKNCIDQEKCGGKYWDVGVQALNYKADEFKKASKQDAIAMSPGSFTPYINIQEKAMKYAKEILGGANGSPFGIQSVSWSSDGKYIVTTKNGAQLQTPLQQLLVNQFGQDQNIQDMFNTQAYVNRKGFIASNSETYGSEDAAEDEYFRQVDSQIQDAQSGYEDAQAAQSAASAKKSLLENKIKMTGSTGDDDLAFDFMAAATDAEASRQATDHAQQTLTVANSIFEAGDNRVMKRLRVDALLGRMSMTKELSDSATTIAALTGTVDVKEDPYAKSYYDHSLRLSEMAAQHAYTKEDDYNKFIYDLTKDAIKDGTLTELIARGGAMDPSNTPTGYLTNTGGATATTDEASQTQQFITTHTNDASAAAKQATIGYANSLMDVLKNPQASSGQKSCARYALQSIFPKTFDLTKDAFTSSDGTSSTNPDVGWSANTGGWRAMYSSALKQKQDFRNVDGLHEFFDAGNPGESYVNQYNTEQTVISNTSALWTKNNKNVLSLGLTQEADATGQANWKLMFNNEGRLRTKDDFTKLYDAAVTAKGPTYDANSVANMGGWLQLDISDTPSASDKYDELYGKYVKLYNGGNSQGVDASGNKVPVVESLMGTPEFQMFGSGLAAQGAPTFTLDSSKPASVATHGFVSFLEDANHNGASYSTGIANVASETSTNADYAAALTQLRTDLSNPDYAKPTKALRTSVSYLPIALSNENLIGMNVKFDASWLQKYKGTSKEPTWADNLLTNTDAMSNGVTVYTKKNGATNDFTNTFTRQPWDVMINHTGTSLSVTDGGQIDISKRNPDGSINLSGYITTVDASGQKINVPLSSLANTQFGSDTGGQQLVDGIYDLLNKTQASNKSIISGTTQGKYFNSLQFPILQQATNPTPAIDNNVFLQGIQYFQQQYPMQ